MIAQTYCGGTHFHGGLRCNSTDGPCPYCLREHIARLEARVQELEAQAAAQAGGVVVPELTEGQEIELFRKHAHKDEWPDDGVSDDTMADILWGFRVGLRALSASRALGAGSVVVSKQFLEDVESALGNAQGLGPCGLGLLCQVQDAIRAAKGGAA